MHEENGAFLSSHQWNKPRSITLTSFRVCPSGNGATEHRIRFCTSSRTIPRPPPLPQLLLPQQVRSPKPYSPTLASVGLTRSLPSSTSSSRPITPSNPHLPDWYSIFQLHPLSDNTPLIRKQFDKLSLLLNPLTNYLPFSQDAFTLVRDAWSLLSRTDKKAFYDRRLAQHSSKMEDNGDTFWTLCPYCYCLFQYYRVYEDCCLRCQNCTRAFQAVMIPSPPKAVEGTDQYCCFGFFPLGFSGNVDEPKNDFVDISDESGDSSGELRRKKKGHAMNLDGEKPKEEQVEKGGDRSVENIKTGDGDGDGEFGVTGKTRVMNVERAKPEEEEVRKASESIGEKVKTSEDGFLSPNVTKRPMKRKSVAKNTKKLMGTGKRGRRYQNIIFAMGTDKLNCNVEAGSGVEEGGAGMVGGLGSGSSGVCVFAGRELYEEDDDIPVGVPISCDGWNGNFKSF